MNERQVVFITGASRGIGAATALEFARRKYDLVLLADAASELESVAAEVRSIGVSALVQHGSLLDLEFAHTAVEAAICRYGRLDVLVNNAAWGETVTMRRISLESWEKTLRVCLTAPAFLARWATESMEAQGSGVIINISSIMSTQADGLSPAYTASKGGLDALTYELASLYGPRGVRVVAINPGAIDTKLGNSFIDMQGENATASVQEFSEDMIMLRRWGKPEEIAKIIAFAASQEASYLTGTTIHVDGGWIHQHFPLSLRQRLLPGEFPSPT